MPDLNDLMPTTPDLNQERLEQLKKLMPDLFTNDGRLNVDELQRVVDPDLVTESERFEFRWFGKAAAKRAAFTPSTAALQYDGSRSVNLDAADGNLIIEGENLEALKCLLSAYREKVKCIYIELLKAYITAKEATLYSLFNEADIFDEVMLKNGFMLSYTRTRVEECGENNVYLVHDDFKQALVCLDAELNEETIAQLKGRSEVFICLERAVDTTKKWNLKQMLGERLVAF